MLFDPGTLHFANPFGVEHLGETSLYAGEVALSGAFLHGSGRRQRGTGAVEGTGRHAAEAKQWGLANHVVPKGFALTKAREIARQLADGPPLLFPAIKQLLRHTEMVPEHEAFELHDSLDLVQQVVRSEDLKEGTKAFSEKRKPHWTGR